MSRISSAGAGIEAKLEALPAMAGIDVLYDRQKDVEAAALAAVEKAKGIFVTVMFMGKRKRREGVGRWQAVYLIQVWGRPIIRDGDTPIDDIVEAIEAALDGESIDGAAPDGIDGHYYHEVEVRDVGLIPDRTWLKFGIEVELDLQL